MAGGGNAYGDMLPGAPDTCTRCYDEILYTMRVLLLQEYSGWMLYEPLETALPIAVAGTSTLL